MAEMLRAQGEKTEATVAVQSAMKSFKTLGSKFGQEQAKETLSLLLVERGQPEKAPKRGEALRTLNAMVKAMEKRNVADLKDAEEKLNAMEGLITENDYADALEPLFARDAGVIDFLTEQGWE